MLQTSSPGHCRQGEYEIYQKNTSITISEMEYNDENFVRFH